MLPSIIVHKEKSNVKSSYINVMCLEPKKHASGVDGREVI
jgi:hypothetical protein